MPGKVGPVRSSRSLLALLLVLFAALVASCGAGARPWGRVVIPPGQPLTLALAVNANAAPDSADAAMREEAALALAVAGTVQGHSLQTVAIPVHCGSGDATTLVPDAAMLRGVIGVIGPACSDACVYSEGALYEQRLTMITPACTAAAVVQQGFPTVFRLAWDDNEQAVIAAEYARRNLRVGHAAVISDGSVYARSLAEAFKFTFRGNGGSIVADLTTSAVVADAPRLARELQATPAGAVFFAARPRPGPDLAAALQGALPGVAFMGPASLLASSDCGAGGDCRLDAALAQNRPNAYIAVGLEREGNTFRSELDLGGHASFRAQTADAVHLYVEALRKVGRARADGALVVDLKQLRAAIAGQSLRGASGRIAFDPFGERYKDTGAELYQVRDGRLIPLGMRKGAS